MAEQETKIFPVSMINQNLWISLDNIFDWLRKRKMILKEENRLNWVTRNWFRQRKKMSKLEKVDSERKVAMLRSKSKNVNSIAILYSFITLEHTIYTICSSLKSKDDADFINELSRKRPFWQNNKETQTLQITDIKKALHYLLKRDEIKNCLNSCKWLSSDSLIQSFIENGHKIKNTYVHWIFGYTEAVVSPIWNEITLDEGGWRKIVQQKMSVQMIDTSRTTFSDAVKKLKRDEIFKCSHTTGDPSHVCLSMAFGFCVKSYTLIRALATHYGIAINAWFFCNDVERVTIINSKDHLNGWIIKGKKIDFSINEITSLFNEMKK